MTEPEEPSPARPSTPPTPPHSTDRILIERIQEQQAERLKAEREPVGSLWRTVAQVGTLGWLLALPPVLGAFLGHLLDMRLQTGITWALGLLFMGLLAGAYFFWRTVQEAQDKL
mgnify:CR=1 FL=1